MTPLATRLATAPYEPWPAAPVPISLVITELDIGGAEKALVALATSLDSQRWRPSVIGLGGEGPLVAPLRDRGIEVACLSVSKRRPGAACSRLARQLLHQSPRLVQSFLFHANIASRIAALRAGRPWVLGGIRVAEREKRWHGRLERITQTLGCGSVCVSEGVRRFSVATFGLDPERLTVIPNGIEPCPILPPGGACNGLPAGPPVALFLGRLTHQKGVDLLLAAFKAVARDFPDWLLAIAGDGDQRGALERAAEREAELVSRVRFLGRRDDIDCLMARASLLVLSSRWEGMPNVVLEAMASRLPVVATRVEGTEELVDSGRTGWLVPAADVPALTAALRGAMSDPGERARRAEAARVRVTSQFSQAAVTAAYERLWARVIGLDLASAPGRLA